MNEEKKFNPDTVKVKIQEKKKEKGRVRGSVGGEEEEENSNGKYKLMRRKELRSWMHFCTQTFLAIFTSACPLQKEKEFGDKVGELR